MARTSGRGPENSQKVCRLLRRRQKTRLQRESISSVRSQSVEGIGKYNDGDLRVYDIFITDKENDNGDLDNSAIKG